MVTKRQVEKMRKAVEKGKLLHVAATIGGMDEKTARKYLKDVRTPEEMRKRREGRTRPDPFAGVWDEAREMLGREPGLEGKTVFAELMRRHPGAFGEGQLRTLQRRVRRWRATEGPGKEVMFAQEHLPGRLGAYDFTDMNDLMVTIQGVHFKHELFHFVLTYSNWEWEMVCHGETFENVSTGLQGAFWDVEGVPWATRSDNLTAAVQTIGQSKRFQTRYADLLKHLGTEGTAINAGKSHENGDVESSHGHFKNAVDQALMLRGSRDFWSVTEYEAFLADIVAQKNAPRVEKLAEERAVLRRLPERKIEACKVFHVRVGAGSTINVDRNIYSVDSKLVGAKVEARMYAGRIEVWYGGEKLQEMPRLLGRGRYQIDYRHVVGSLMRKPGAFAQYRYQAALFPCLHFRMAYDRLRQDVPLRAHKEYVALLDCAKNEGEEKTRAVLEAMLAANETPRAAEVKARVTAGSTPPPVALGQVMPVDLAAYDALLETTSAQEVGHERAA
jgi:hypothetical protein